MLNMILGKKIGMTQIFYNDGDEKSRQGLVVPVTVLLVGPCKVVQIRTKEKDGYEAVQIGFEESTRVKKPQLGQQEKANLVRTEVINGREKKVALKHLREVKATDYASLNIGDTINIGDIFAEGDLVDITGLSKGKGFAGVMKRHNFSGGPRTHGQSDRERAPGSIGSGTTPGHVVKGMRMAGHMGQDNVTTQNLTIMRIDAERNLLLVKGAVPGATGGIITIRKAVKVKK